MPKIKVAYIEAEYIGVFRKLPNGLVYLREWMPKWFKEASTWLKKKRFGEKDSRHG